MKREVKIISHKVLAGSNFESYWKDSVQEIEIEGGYPKRILFEDKNKSGIDFSEKIGETVILDFPTPKESKEYTIIYNVDIPDVSIDKPSKSFRSIAEELKKKINSSKDISILVKHKIHNGYVHISQKEGGFNTTGNHYELKDKRNELFVEAHFEVRNYNSTFKELITDLPERYEWFSWYGADSIRQKKSYSYEEEDVVNKLYEDFIQMDLALGDMISEIKKTCELNDVRSANLSINIFDNEITRLLFNKKQIILQGPPGTGKTRLAKQIAQKMGGDLSVSEIKTGLRVNDKISNVSGVDSYYTIKEIKDRGIVLSSERATKEWEPTYDKIIEKYSLLVNGEQIDNKNGLHPYELAVAKYFFNKSNLSYSIIQFHPSYTYEDFVRGISIKNNDNGQLEYKTENKILAEIALQAQQNYINSKKDSSEINYEKWIEEQFEEFKELIENTISESESYDLTEKISIQQVGVNYFKYAGNNWHGYIKYSSFLSLYFNKTFELKAIKKFLNINSRSTYYAKLVERFDEFLKDKEVPKASNNKVVLKNYVLIIDEINRANLSSVLGELIYALEYRGEPVESMYAIEDEGNKIVLPQNLYIIGTMNTADRSVGQIDYAVRRRFAFIDVLPQALNESTLEDDLKFNTEVFNEVADLFVGENNHLSDEFNAKDVQLGHSYFIHKPNEFDLKLKYEIQPILREYVTDGILKESALSIINDLVTVRSND